MRNCRNCKSKDIVEGYVGATGELIFDLSTATDPVSSSAIAIACMSCGYIHLNYNPETVKICFCKSETPRASV